MLQEIKGLTMIFILLIVGCNETKYMQGKRLYEAKCQNCHMEDGSGLVALIPPLNSSSLLGNVSMACLIRNGIQDTIFRDSTFLVKEMPAFKKFTAAELTNIMNYVNSTWHKSFKEITIIETEAAIKNCQ